MTDLIEILESFNTKERFFLIGAALGNPTFKLSEDYSKALSKAQIHHLIDDAVEFRS